MEQNEFRRILLRAVVLPLVLLAIVAGVLLWQISRLMASAKWVEHTDQVIAQADDTLRLIVDMETGLRGYLVTGKKDFLEPYERALPEIDPAFDRLGELIADNPGQTQLLAGIRPASVEWRRYARDIIALRDAGGDYQAVADEGGGKRLTDAMRNGFASFVSAEQRLRDTRSSSTQQAAWLAVASVIGLTLVLGGALAHFTRSQLIRLSQAYNRTLTTAQQQAAALQQQATALEESNGRTTRILESIGDSFIALDKDWRFTYVNPQAEQFFNRTRNQLSGKNVWQEFPELAGTDFHHQFHRAAEERAAVKFIGDHPSLDKAFEASAYPSEDGLSVYLNDITERRRAEQEQTRLREEIIKMQAERLEELSTPLIPLSREIVIMPLVGTIDVARAQQILDAAARGVVARGARVAVIDITGVPTVDTHVASTLIQAAQTVRLLGAEAVLTGIRSRVAQTLVGLGVDLGGLVTRSTLQSGIQYATEYLQKETSPLRAD
ncbi:MAG: CHASE3 domain-containing protein [Acidobacteriota bacterium]|nr:CHASE3 domain-containing protein [Acidobacteriota bacterium]